MNETFVNTHTTNTMPFSRMITESSIIFYDVESFRNGLIATETFVILFLNLSFILKNTE